MTTGGVSEEVKPPAIPAEIRTVTYFILLAVSVITVIVVGVAPIWFADALADKIVATGGVISAAMGLVAGGLGVAYRPTR